MSGWIRRSDGAQGFFALLLLCALAIRVAIPTGFMPAQTAHGIVISLCTGEGARTAILPIDHRQDQPDHHGSAGGPCAFAVGLGGPLLDHPTVEPGVAARPIFLQPTKRSIANLAVDRLAAPPPPSHAPPAFS